MKPDRRHAPPWPVVLLVKALNATVIFFFYTIWGYRLPPRPEAADVLAWNKQHGMFMGHRMTASLFDWVGSDLVGTYVPTRGLFIFARNVNTVEKIMTDKVLFPTRGWTGFMAWVPNGLLSIPTGPKWKLHRTLVSKALSTQCLVQYSKTISQKGSALLKFWRDGGPDKECNVQGDLSRTALDIISSIAFGVEMDSLNDPETRWHRAADIILQETALQTMQPWIAKFFPFGRQAKFEAEVAWAIAELRSKGTFESDRKATDDGSVLGLLQTAQKTHNLTDAEVIEEVLTVGGAGHETTANTLSWCLLLLAQNPGVQSQLWAEVDAKIAGEVPTFVEARKLDYCRAAIYETLRLYPTVAIFPRVAARDCKLDGYDVPAGATVLVTQLALNLNPEWYPEPLRFNPDRFVGHHDPHVSLPVGAPKNGPRYAFLPFGAGARTCIGQRLAVLEAIQLLGSITKHFRIELPKGEQTPVREHLSITLRPRDLRLRLVPRT